MLLEEINQPLLYVLSCRGETWKILAQHWWNLIITPDHLNDGANIAKSDDCEGYGLKEEVYEVVVLAVHKIIATTEEKEGCKSQLQ